METNKKYHQRVKLSIGNLCKLLYVNVENNEIYCKKTLN